MNRLDKLFKHKQNGVLNIYFTAGYPKKESVQEVIKTLAKNQVDIIEIGMPYSDPLADGTTIQQSSQIALANGMSVEYLFSELASVRTAVTEVSFVLMGYYNQMLQYGIDKFLDNCNSSGVDGLIIPDLPMNIYESDLKAKFEEKKIRISFLITPQTSDERIKKADELSSGFVYIVSQSSITGTKSDLKQEQINYFQKLQSLKLKSPNLIGFGIHDKASYDLACKYSNGAIIGSAFIRALGNQGSLTEKIEGFISKIKG